MLRKFSVLIACRLVVILLSLSAMAQISPAPQPLTPEERRARIVAACDGMITSYMTLVMLESPRGQGETDRMLHNLTQSPFLAVCYRFGWRYNGIGGLWPLAGATSTNSNPYPASAQGQGYGQAWQWSGRGLCKVEYEGYSHDGQAIEPAPPTESHESIKAFWDESHKVYVVQLGCGRVVGASRAFRFNDQCEQGTAAAPLFQPGCYYKCRAEVQILDGQFSIEADRATLTTESEDSTAANPGSFKYKTSCTFVR